MKLVINHLFKSMNRTYYLEAGEQIVPLTSRVIMVGRAKHAELELTHLSISKEHAYFQIRDDRVFIKDMGAMNGTKVNGQRLERHEEVELHQNDLIEFGKHQSKFRLVSGKEGGRRGERPVKKQRRINLKDMFVSAQDQEGQEEVVTRAGRSVQKKIDLTKIRHSVAGVLQEQPRSRVTPSVSSVSVRKAGETKIRMDNIEDFLKDTKIPDHLDIPDKPSRLSQQKLEYVQPIPEPVAQQPPQLRIDDQQQVQTRKIRLDIQLLRQKQQYQQRLLQERKKYQGEKSTLEGELRRLQKEKELQELRFKDQQRVQLQARQEEMQNNRRELDQKKKAIQLEAEGIGKEYEKIYRETIENVKEQLSKCQEVEVGLDTKINSYRQLIEAESRQYHKQTALGEDLKTKFRKVQAKNKAILLYINYLQQNGSKSQQAPKHFGLKTENKQEEKVEALRKLLYKGSLELAQSKEHCRNLLMECSEGNPRQGYQFEYLLSSTQNIVSMKQELFEYLGREAHADKSWQTQISDNNQLSSKIKSTLLQLDNNKRELQQIHVENARKLGEYHQQFYKLLQTEHNPQKKKAGGFLLSQMVQIQQEKNQIQHNIQELHLEIESIVSSTLRSRSETIQLTTMISSKRQTESRFVHLDALHDQVEALTVEVNDLARQESAPSLLKLIKEIYAYEVDMAQLHQQGQSIRQGLNRSRNNNQTGETALQYFSDLYSQKNQTAAELAIQGQKLTLEAQRLESELSQLQAQNVSVNKLYQKFKANQLQEAQRLVRG